MVKLTSPSILSDQTEEERQYMLVVTASVRRLNFEATRVILGDMVTASAEGVAFQNLQIATVLPGPARGRREIGNQGGTVEERAGKDVE